MKRIFHLAVLISSVLFFGCKKEKQITFSGQLLLTSTFPYTLSNRAVEIYQAGSPSAIGIASGSTSSTATGKTDANGYFRLNFNPAQSFFIIFSGANSHPLILSSTDTSFPDFTRSNFPDSAYDPSNPIFVGKTIEVATIKVNVMSDLTSNDTIGLRANTINGRLDKEYTGRSASAGSVIILDTIKNMLFTRYEGLEKNYINDLYAGRKFTTILGYKTISSGDFVSPSRLSAIDEKQKEIIFNFKR